MLFSKYECCHELHRCGDQSARGNERGGVGSARLAHARDRPVHVHLRALHRGDEHVVEANIPGQGKLAFDLQSMTIDLNYIFRILRVG